MRVVLNLHLISTICCILFANGVVGDRGNFFCASSGVPSATVTTQRPCKKSMSKRLTYWKQKTNIYLSERQICVYTTSCRLYTLTNRGHRLAYKKRLLAQSQGISFSRVCRHVKRYFAVLLCQSVKPCCRRFQRIEHRFVASYMCGDGRTDHRGNVR